MIESIDPDSGNLWAQLFSNEMTSVYPIFFIIIILLLLSALISGSEVAFFSLSPAQLDICKSNGRKSDKQILHLLSKPKQLLSTILILNNLINVGIVTLSTYATWQLFGRDDESALFILSLVVTMAIVFFGEIVPKVFANQMNIAFAKLTSGMLTLSSNLLKPFSSLLMSMGELLEKRLKVKGYQVSVNELDQAVEMATVHEGTVEEKEILKSIVKFGTKSAKQVMKSRIDITAIDIESNYKEVIDIINACGFSRIPVYVETIDKIDGILYCKDLLPYLDETEAFEWTKLIRRETFFVPENKKIDELLRDFQQKRVHMAIVVDEYGGTSGLITMEDIIEEIVGEINDEFDNDDLIYRRIDDATFTFEGKTSLNDFCKIIKVEQEEFHDAKGDSESLGGLLLELFGKLPISGEQIEYKNFFFTVVSADKKRIKSVRVLLTDRIKAAKTNAIKSISEVKIKN
ncbi:gliding motility-associated protein GldE [Rapidithrix thailandica]|uniref:Gliding motility-associated protein GldE n=1 Tax=Rapidithrix thailandica TaxID=413964 RepID=A0AAW9S3L2_9BACT